MRAHSCRPRQKVKEQLFGRHVSSPRPLSFIHSRAYPVRPDAVLQPTGPQNIDDGEINFRGSPVLPLRLPTWALKEAQRWYIRARVTFSPVKDHAILEEAETSTLLQSMKGHWPPSVTTAVLRHRKRIKKSMLRAAKSFMFSSTYVGGPGKEMARSVRSQAG